jgi:hypothetical protein
MSEGRLTVALKDPESRGRLLFLFRVLQLVVLAWILIGVALFLFFYSGAFSV